MLVAAVRLLGEGRYQLVGELIVLAFQGGYGRLQGGDRIRLLAIGLLKGGELSLLAVNLALQAGQLILDQTGNKDTECGLVGGRGGVVGELNVAE